MSIKKLLGEHASLDTFTKLNTLEEMIHWFNTVNNQTICWKALFGLEV